MQVNHGNQTGQRTFFLSFIPLKCSLSAFFVHTRTYVRYLPIIGQIVGGWIFKKLAFVFELASNFIAAHEDIDILELLPEGRFSHLSAL